MTLASECVKTREIYSSKSLIICKFESTECIYWADYKQLTHRFRIAINEIGLSAVICKNEEEKNLNNN